MWFSAKTSDATRRNERVPILRRNNKVSAHLQRGRKRWKSRRKSGATRSREHNWRIVSNRGKTRRNTPLEFLFWAATVSLSLSFSVCQAHLFLSASIFFGWPIFFLSFFFVAVVLPGNELRANSTAKMIRILPHLQWNILPSLRLSLSLRRPSLAILLPPSLSPPTNSPIFVYGVSSVSNKSKCIHI